MKKSSIFALFAAAILALPAAAQTGRATDSSGPRQGADKGVQGVFSTEREQVSRYRNGYTSTGFAFAPKGSIPTISDAPKTVRRQAPPEIADFKIFGALGGTADPTQGALYTLTPSGMQYKAKVRSVDGGAYFDGTNFNTVSRWIASLPDLFYLYRHETTWWTSTSTSINSSCRGSDFALDPTTGRCYGSFYDGQYNGKWQFASVDFSQNTTNGISNSKKVLCNIDMADGVAINSQGIVYLIDYLGDLYIIDKTTSRHKFVGSTGLTPYYQGSATFDRDDRLFYSCNPEEGPGALYEVNPQTAEVTKIFDYTDGLQLVGLYAPVEVVNSNAPGKITDISIDFGDGSSAPVLQFTLPSTLKDGSAATGTCWWYIKNEGGYTMASGSGQYGDVVRYPYSGWPGKYTFSFIASNDEGGDGQSTEFSCIIGDEPPTPPTNVRHKLVGDQLTLIWDAPLRGDYGGELDPEFLTYDIQDVYGNDIVTDVQGTECTFTVNLPATPTTTGYRICAKYKGMYSNLTYTDEILIGYYSAPWNCSFSNANQFKTYLTVHDANNDGQTWGYFSSGQTVCYANNNDLPSDDWLVTPGVRLDAGKLYTLSAYMKIYNESRPDRVAICVGRTNQVEDMTTCILDPMVPWTSWMPVDAEFVPREEGVYYFGIHSCSEGPSAGLYLMALALSAPGDASGPEMPSDFNVISAADGSLKADITLTAPTASRAGETINTLSKVVLMRGGSTIKEWTDVAGGTELSYTDAVSDAGVYNYQAVAYMDSKQGRMARTEAYVGVALPAQPTAVTAVETATPGQVTVSWNAVTTDENGLPIRPEFVKYYVFRYHNGEQTAVQNDIEGTSLTFDAGIDGQEFCQYAVAAKTTAGYSSGVLSRSIAVGTPYTLPYAESFAGGKANTAWGVESLVNSYQGEWHIASDESFTDVTSADGDGGFAYHYCKYIDRPTRLYSGKINMTGCQHPVLEFYLLDLFNSLKDKPDHRNTSLIEVEVNPMDGTGWHSLTEQTVADACDYDGWNRVLVDLNEYKGKTIQIAFKATTKKYIYVNIDAIRIDDIAEKDVAVKYISAPSSTYPGAEFDIIVGLENLGSQTAQGYKVTLHHQGKPLETITGPELATGQKGQVKFTRVLGHAHDDNNSYHATVRHTGDTNPQNDAADPVQISIVRTDLPVVENLTVTTDDDNKGATLTWSEPTVEEGALPEVLEDFENAGSWGNEVPGWIFLDENHGGAGGLQGVVLPGVPNGSEQSWFVIDARTKFLDRNLETQMNFATASGNKMIGAMFEMDFSTGPYPSVSVPNDEWAISPRLSGTAQTIKLKARSYSPYFLENFEILYSLTGTDPDDFYTLEETDNVPADAWTEYEYSLPDGAQHFAIRYTADYKFMLFIDDVIYTPYNDNPLQLVGYDIYRDEQKITDEPLPVGTTSYADRFENGFGRYALCAVYNHGVSKPASVQAEYQGDSFEVDGIWYSVLTAETVGVTKPESGSYSGEVTIPATVGYWGKEYNVTEILPAVFGNASVTKVNLPEGLLTIGQEAFSGASLREINIPNTVTTLGARAFYMCYDATSLTIGESVTAIPDECFGVCMSLPAVNIPDAVESIGNLAFKGCGMSVQSLTIGAGVKSIGAMAFYNFSNVSEIVLPEGLESIAYAAFEQCNGITQFEIPSTVTSLGDGPVSGRKLAKISVAEGNTAYTAWNDALYTADLATLIVYPEAKQGQKALLPDELKTIGTNACARASFSQVDLPEGLTTIGQAAFYNSMGVQEVNFPSTLQVIEQTAFYGNDNLAVVNFQEAPNFESIGIMAFAYCGSQLENVVLPEGLKALDDQVFYGCENLQNVAFPTTLKTVGTQVFFGCPSLEEAIFQEGLQTLGIQTFYGCTGLKTLVLPNSVLTFGEGLCYGCTALETLKIGSGVNSIAYNAFRNCPALKNVYSYNTVPPEDPSFDQNVYSSATLWVPKGYISAYSNSETDWHLFLNKQEINDSGLGQIFSDSEPQAIYTLHGVRLGTKAPEPGLYIVVRNGVSKIEYVK